MGHLGSEESMTEEQGVAVVALLGQIQFCCQCTAIAACLCFAAQLFRLVLQGLNSKKVI
jgi:hypothetical protein